jgi:M6 family metalloprotease-like protein
MQGTAQAGIPATPGPQTANLSGILTIKWGAAHGHASPQTIYELVDDQQQVHRLAIDPERMPAPGGILPFNGKHVTLQATPEAAPSRPGLAPRLQVAAVELSEPPARAAVAPAISGSQPFITLMCKFADYAGEPRALPFFASQLGGARPGFDHYIRELSYGMVNLDGSTAVGWLTLPQDRAAYVPDGGQINLNQLAADCTAAAGSVNFLPFYGINFVFNGPLDDSAWGGSTVLTLNGEEKAWPATWMPYHDGSTFGWLEHSILAHEIAHAFGSPHSANSTDYQYGSSWDVVSDPQAHCDLPGVTDGVYGCVGQHVIGANKDAMGFIPAGRKYTYAGSGQQTVILERLAQPDGAAGTFVLAQIPINGSADDFYTIEARLRVGYDIALPGDGVIIHRVNKQRENQAWIVPPPGSTPDSMRQGEVPGVGDLNALWPVGSTFTDAANGIAVRVNGFSSQTGTAVISINPCSQSMEPSIFLPMLTR